MNTYGKRKKSIVPPSVMLLGENKVAKPMTVKTKRNSSTTIAMAAFYGDQNEEPIRTISTHYHDSIRTFGSDLKGNATVSERAEEQDRLLSQFRKCEPNSQFPQTSYARDNGFPQISRPDFNNDLVMPNEVFQSEAFVEPATDRSAGFEDNGSATGSLPGHKSNKGQCSLAPTPCKPSKRRCRLSKSKQNRKLQVQDHHGQSPQDLPRGFSQGNETPESKGIEGLNRRIREVFKSGKRQRNELKVAKIFAKVKSTFRENRSDNEYKKNGRDDERVPSKEDSPVTQESCIGTPYEKTRTPVSAAKLRNNESDNLRKSKIQKINKHGDTLTEDGDYAYHHKTSFLKRSKSLSFKMITRRNKYTGGEKRTDAQYMGNSRRAMDPFTEDTDPGTGSRLPTSFEEKCKKPEDAAGDSVFLPLSKNVSHSFRAEIARMSQVKDFGRTSDVSNALFSSSPIAESTPRCRLEPAFEEDGSSKLQRVPASMRSRFDTQEIVGEENGKKNSENTTPLYTSRRRPIIAMSTPSSQIGENELGGDSESSNKSRMFLSPASKAHPSPAHSVLEEFGNFFSSPEKVTQKFGYDIPRNLDKSCFAVAEEDSLADSFSELKTARPLSPKNRNELVNQIPNQKLQIDSVEGVAASSGTGSFQGVRRQSKIPRPTSVYSIHRSDSRAMNLDGSAFDMDYLQRDDSEFNIASKRA